MAIDWENLSNKPKTTTTTGSGIDWEDLGNKYAEQYKYNDAINKIKNIDTLKNAQEKYNAVVNASKLGLIDRTQLGKALEYVKTKQDEKIKSDFQKNLTPLEKASTFVAEGVPQLAKGLYEGTIDAAVQTGDAYLKYMNSKNMQSMNSAVLKDAMAISKKAIADAQAGKISWDKAKQITDQTNKMVSLTSGKANKATKELSKQDAAKVAGAAATTALNLLTLGGAGMVKAGLTGGAKALAGAAGKEALLGTGYGVANVAQTMGKEATAQDYLTGAGVGTAFGGAIPVAGAGLKYVGRKGATALEEATSKIKASKPAQYLFGDKTAVQEAVAKAKAPKVVETPKVEPTVAEKPITPPKKIEVTTPQVTKTPQATAALKQEALKYKSADEFVAKDNTQFADLPNYKFDLAQAQKDFAEIHSLTEKITTGMPKDATKAQRVKVYKDTITAVNKKYGTNISTDINDILDVTRNSNKYPNELAYEAGRKAKTDLYNQAHTQPKTPVGEQRVTGGAKKLEAQTGVKLEKPATYDETSYKTNKITSDEFVDNNKEGAFKALEDKTLGDAQRQETYKSLSRKVQEEFKKTGNMDDVQRLGRISTLEEQSKAAQILGQSGYLADPKDPFKIINDVKKVKEKAVSGRVKGKITEQVKKDAVSIKSNIKAPTKQDWAGFVESLRCK